MSENTDIGHHDDDGDDDDDGQRGALCNAVSDDETPPTEIHRRCEFKQDSATRPHCMNQTLGPGWPGVVLYKPCNKGIYFSCKN